MNEPMAAHPLRGRDDVWRQVTDTIRRTGARERALVIVEGHAGAGKSRLLREVLDAARRSGCVTIDGHAWQPPVRATTGDQGEPRLDVRPDTGLAVVAWDDDASLDPGFVQAWARAAALPVVILVARQTGSRLATPFGPDGGLTVHVSLGPLSAEAVGELIADRLGRAPSPALLGLAAAAAGRPGAVVELLHDMHAERLLNLGSDPVTPIRTELPERTRHRIAEQLAQASPTARHLVQVTATVSDGGSLPDLAALLRRGPASLVPAVEEALATGLLVGRGNRLICPHELVRREIVRSLPPSVQAALCPSGTGAVSARATAPAPAPARTAAAGAPEPRLIPGWERLSVRQREVAVLAGEALTNGQIADRLYVAQNTIKFHLRQIFRELGISSRVQLVKLMGP